MTEAETRLLQRVTRDKHVVEAGALLGYSTIRIAEVARKVVSIDRHEGYTTDTYRRYRSNLQRARVRDRVAVVRAEAVPAIKAAVGDVGFVDLTGQFELTRDALRAMQPRLVLVHDVGRAHCRVDDAIGAAGFRVVEAVDTLALCVRAA